MNTNVPAYYQVVFMNVLGGQVELCSYVICAVACDSTRKSKCYFKSNDVP